jgi:hypothetical protein
MIRTFEEFTHELTDLEIEHIVPWLERELLYRFEDRPITNKELVKGCPIKTSTPRIRKMIHALRVNGRITFLIANSKGYFRSNNKKIVSDYHISLLERASSIREVADAINEQYHMIGEVKQQTLF